MHPLTINNKVSPACRYFSDLKLQHLPDTKFTVGSWIAGDKWMSFCAELIRMSIHNLVLNDTLSIVSKTHEMSVVFLRIEKTKYFCRLNNHDWRSSTHAFLERMIIEQVDPETYTGFEQLLENVFDQLLINGETFANPGKEVIAKLINEHAQGFLSSDMSKSFFGNRVLNVQLNFSPATTELLGRIETNIHAEINGNPKFGDFNRALAGVIRKVLNGRQDASD